MEEKANVMIIDNAIPANTLAALEAQLAEAGFATATSTVGVAPANTTIGFYDDSQNFEWANDVKDAVAQVDGLASIILVTPTFNGVEIAPGNLLLYPVPAAKR